MHPPESPIRSAWITQEQLNHQHRVAVIVHMAQQSTGRVANPGTPEPGQRPADERRHNLAWPFIDRRSGQDRRDHPTRWYDSLVGHRRRLRGRRTGESRNIYVDLYHTADLILLALIFSLNLLDAGLTLNHISNGGIEQNPLMESLIYAGPGYFLLEKVVVVGLCLIAVAVHRTFRVARTGAWILLSLYTLLMLQHLSLLV